LSKSFFYVGVRNHGAGQQIGAAVLAGIEEPNQQLKKKLAELHPVVDPALAALQTQKAVF